MSTYRVELNKAGHVVDVRLVDQKIQEGHSVFYVEAKGADEAGQEAMRAYARRKMKEKRERLDREGRCRCSRKRDIEGRKTCSVCRSNAQGTRERIGKVAPPGQSQKLRLEKSAKRSRDRRAELEHEVLLRLSEKLHEPGVSIARLRVWVAKELRRVRNLPSLRKAS